jgi:hypothetical protein
MGSTKPATEISTRNISLPPWCADCLKIWEPQPPGTLRACQGLNGIALPFTVKLCMFRCTGLCSYFCRLFICLSDACFCVVCEWRLQFCFVRVCYVEICMWTGIEVLWQTVPVIAFTSYENVACDVNPGTWVFTWKIFDKKFFLI